MHEDEIFKLTDPGVAWAGLTRQVSEQSELGLNSHRLFPKYPHDGVCDVGRDDVDQVYV